MKTKFITSAVATILLLIITSCTKDIPTDNTIPPPNNPTTNPGPLLIKYYEIDTTLLPPLDTVYKVSYTYNASNRPMTKFECETDENGDSIYYSLLRYDYNGADSVVFRTITYTKTFSSSPVNETDTLYYTFSAQKRVGDSIRNSNGTIITNKYSYNSTFIKRNTIFTYPTLEIYNGINNIYLTKSGNNITYQIDTTVTSNILTPGSTSSRKETVTVTYLTNPNPFYHISFPTRKEYFTDYIGNEGDAAPENLISQLNYNDAYWNNNNLPYSTAAIQLNYTYTFRPDGYPSGGTFTKTNSSYTRHRKNIYIYQ